MAPSNLNSSTIPHILCQNEDSYCAFYQHTVFLWFLVSIRGMVIENFIEGLPSFQLDQKQLTSNGLEGFSLRPVEITQNPHSVPPQQWRENKGTIGRRESRDENGPKLVLLRKGRENRAQGKKQKRNIHTVSHSFCLLGGYLSQPFRKKTSLFAIGVALPSSL